MPRSAGSIALFAALAALGATVAGELHARGFGPRYANPSLRLRQFAVPRGWEQAPQIGYPGVLVLASTPDGARLTLGAQRVATGSVAINLAADARAALLRRRYGEVRVTPFADRDDKAGLDCAELDGMVEGGHGRLRQRYVVDGDLAWVLTVFAPATHPTRAEKDFEEAWRSLRIDRLVAPASDGGIELAPGSSDGGHP